jgi:hypothetical protein
MSDFSGKNISHKQQKVLSRVFAAVKDADPALRSRIEDDLRRHKGQLKYTGSEWKALLGRCRDQMLVARSNRLIRVHKDAQEVKRSAWRFGSAAQFLKSSLEEGGEAVQWASQIQSLRFDANFPLQSQLQWDAGVPAPVAMAKLHQAILDRLERLELIFDQLTRSVARVETKVKSLGGVEKFSSPDGVNWALDRARGYVRILEQSERTHENLFDEWTFVDSLGSLVYPADREMVWGDMTRILSFRFDEEYAPLQEVISSLKGALEDYIATLQLKGEELTKLEKDREARELAERVHQLVQELGEKLDEANGRFEQDSDAASTLLAELKPLDTTTAEGRTAFFKRLTDLRGFSEALRVDVRGDFHVDPKIAPQVYSMLDDRVDKLGQRVSDFNKELEGSWKKLSHRGMRLEEEIEIPKLELPPAKNESIYILDRGDEGIFEPSLDDFDISPSLIRHVFDRFKKARALVVGEDVFMVDRRTAERVETWKSERLNEVKGKDLLGAEYSLAKGQWGVRAVPVIKFDKSHPFRKIQIAMGRVRMMQPLSSKDFVARMAVSAKDSRGEREIFVKLLSDLIAPGIDEIMKSGKEEGMLWHHRIAASMRGLYDELKNNPDMKESIETWFDWRPNYQPSPSDIKLLTPEQIEHLDGMSMSEMETMIAKMGILPLIEGQRNRLVAEWVRKNAQLDWLDSKALPVAFVHYMSSVDPSLTEKLIEFEKSAQKESEGDIGPDVRSRTAIRFLYLNQNRIVDKFFKKWKAFSLPSPAYLKAF